MLAWEGSLQRVRSERRLAEWWWSLITQALSQHIIFEISLIITLAVRWWVLWAVFPKSVLSSAKDTLCSVCLVYSGPLNTVSLQCVGLLTWRLVVFQWIPGLFFIGGWECVDGEGWLYASTYTILPGGREHSWSGVSVGGPGTSPPQVLKDNWCN